MSPLMRSDVKNHLRPPFLPKPPWPQLESQPDATGFSLAESDAINAKRSGFAEDFVTEHSLSRVAAAKADAVNSSIRPEEQGGSKSARA